MEETNGESEIEDRRASLREWYSEVIERKKKEFGGQSPFKKLDYDDLFNEIRNHDQVTFFGGASLTVLHELLEKQPELGKKVRYFQQGGTFDPKLNILGNPYNFALNIKAAEYVFKHHDKLLKFALILTDTAKKLEWTAQGLAKLSPAVGLRSLAFHGLYDPWELISPKEDERSAHTSEELLALRAELTSDPRYSAPKSKGHKAVMADLTAFLAAFTDVFENFRTKRGSLKQTSIKVAMEQTIPDSNQMVLREDQTSKIECLMFTPGQETQDTLLVEDALELLKNALKTAVPFT